MTWVRYSTAFPTAKGRPIDYVELGPDVPSLDRRESFDDHSGVERANFAEKP